MKTKTTEWTPEEEELLARAIREKISPMRLSVRLNRSVGSIKRRMRELGLGEKKQVSQNRTSELDEVVNLVSQSPLRFEIDPSAVVAKWLETARAGNLSGLLSLYHEEAVLECACEDAVFAGRAAIMQYWANKLSQRHVEGFSIDAVEVHGEEVRLDYRDFENKPVRVFFSFDGEQNIVRTRCGPTGCVKARTLSEHVQ